MWCPGCFQGYVLHITKCSQSSYLVLTKQSQHYVGIVRQANEQRIRRVGGEATCSALCAVRFQSSRTSANVPCVMGCHFGSHTWKVLPWPITLSAQIAPSCS